MWDRQHQVEEAEETLRRALERDGTDGGLAEKVGFASEGHSAADAYDEVPGE
jgi:hypothetical protein